MLAVYNGGGGVRNAGLGSLKRFAVCSFSAKIVEKKTATTTSGLHGWHSRQRQPHPGRASSYVQTPEALLRHHGRERGPVVGEQVFGPDAGRLQPGHHQPLEPRELAVDTVRGRVLPLPPRQQDDVLGVVAGRPGARGHLRGQFVDGRVSQPVDVARRGHVHVRFHGPLAVFRPHVHLVHAVTAQAHLPVLQVLERRLVRQQERFAPHGTLQQQKYVRRHLFIDVTAPRPVARTHGGKEGGGEWAVAPLEICNPKLYA